MAIVKVSDLVTHFLVDQGIKDVFMISGGGMMHLLDSVERQEGLNPVFNLNEQASAICAEAYAEYNENLGVCMVTTGPGATNAVTGCAGAWLSSTPVIYISGQVKTSQMGQIRGLRSYGLQEVAIIPCVRPITKYAVTVMEKNDILYHLQKAVFLAKNGRKGPVWIDIPLDIQGSYVDSESLRRFENDDLSKKDIETITDADIMTVFQEMNKAKRPAVLAGYGVVAAHAQNALIDFINYTKIPVLTTWRLKGVFGANDDLFYGSPGVPAIRYSNYIIQNTDFLLIIGTRLNPLTTAYDESNFAPNAKKIIVDIDVDEIEKLNMSFEMKIVSDAQLFLKKMNSGRYMYVSKERIEWITYCNRIKEKYPLYKEKQPMDIGRKVDGYKVAKVLSDYSNICDVFVGASAGRACGISHMAYEVKKGQRYVGELGLGSMGWTLPAAIGACIASEKRRTLLIEGEGSLQHNIQELQLIRTYDLPIKILVYENDGYASIFAMQRNNFENRFIGCDKQSGLIMPRVKDIADAYRIPYYLITEDVEIETVVKKIMLDNNSCICEIKGSKYFDEIPKSMTIMNADGSLTSSKLENLYPFVTEEDQRDNMPCWKD